MRKKYLTLFIIGILILRATLDFWVSIMPECFTLKYLGVYCPGCGATRAVVALLNGKVWSAFCYNPGVVAICVIIILAFIEKITNKKILPRKSFFWVVFIIVLFIYYAFRNFTLFQGVL